jgi:hypothetical protein
MDTNVAELVTKVVTIVTNNGVMATLVVPIGWSIAKVASYIKNGDYVSAQERIDEEVASGK